MFNFDNSLACLPDILYSKLPPEQVPAPEMLLFNESLADDLELKWRDISFKQLAVMLAGNIIPNGADPLAIAYAGHQYGHFVVLGDGRAILLGEHVKASGERFDVQLKGSGKTKYSRRGDGKAALKPMLREYIISEAMFALGIPTTRSLSVVKTGEMVMRDEPQSGAVLTRIASSHIRVGNFEYLAHLNDVEALQTLLNYSINRHYPDAHQAENPALAFLKEVIDRQAKLVCEWLRVGFVHGVMNTDNMSICGETIDYGPCAFLDEYHSAKTFSSIDRFGRYAFNNQPVIAQWNLSRLAEAILPLLHDEKSIAIKLAEEAIYDFDDIFANYWLDMMRGKLGLFTAQNNDIELIQELLELMQDNHIDYTLFFNDLSEQNTAPYQPLKQWLKNWELRLESNQKPISDAIKLMQQNNPCIIPRNHQVDYALNEAENGNLKPAHNLITALKNPYKLNVQNEYLQSAPKAHEKIYQTFCGT
jgi:uncharacterized protein YdiU (UPF0061 family)